MSSAKKEYKIPKPGIMEKVGIWYWKILLEKDRKRGYIAKEYSDETIEKKVKTVTYWGMIVSFIVGAVSAWGTVIITLRMEGEPNLYVYYGWIFGLTGVYTVIELLIVFWVALLTVFKISRITGHNELSDEDKHELEDDVANLLARAALEIPDPVKHFLGIDPMVNVSKRKLLMMAILYKAKVFLSNVLARFILRRFLLRTTFRSLANWVSIPITGFWNALVLHKVAKEARLRIFGNIIARHMVDEIITDDIIETLSPEAKSGCLRAVAISIVVSQKYHPNMMVLLIRLYMKLELEERYDYHDWDSFKDILVKVEEKEKYFILDVLSVSTAFDGRISRMEREMLKEFFGEHSDVYYERIEKLKTMMISGRLHETKESCYLNFEPG